MSSPARSLRWELGAFTALAADSQQCVAFAGRALVAGSSLYAHRVASCQHLSRLQSLWRASRVRPLQPAGVPCIAVRFALARAGRICSSAPPLSAVDMGPSFTAEACCYIRFASSSSLLSPLSVDSDQATATGTGAGHTHKRKARKHTTRRGIGG